MTSYHTVPSKKIKRKEKKRTELIKIERNRTELKFPVSVPF